MESITKLPLSPETLPSTGDETRAVQFRVADPKCEHFFPWLKLEVSLAMLAVSSLVGARDVRNI